jgi:HPt (histidine-containing phosphotransfer) domain-containing protein
MSMSKTSEEGAASNSGAPSSILQSILVAETLDLKHTTQLRNLKVAGGRSLFAELCTILRTEAPGRFTALREAIEKKDNVQAGKLAHSFVGSAAAVGARQLQAGMRAMELASGTTNWQQIDDCMLAIDEAWKRLVLAIDEMENQGNL